MTLSKAPAIHSGEILRDLYLEPLGMSAYALAKTLRVPRTRIERIVAEKIGISADTALRLAKFFRTTPELWLNLQSNYHLKKQSAELGSELAKIPELGEAA
ncbi:HigA family addiction module antitoxin [Rhizobium straminoryzae]|uniref:HigA family addiction module antidote protein n=1 Tax=Rhizobium straminoryzae TaxID=1387186 RepID=A0A549T527_9HYPH|nr:HigA family addiction module antitoxin [Rhizobium straminoryzae]TRL36973.1 HigA family addiction module antidote protein [Rhizobium straminoryzae]